MRGRGWFGGSFVVLLTLIAATVADGGRLLKTPTAAAEEGALSADSSKTPLGAPYLVSLAAELAALGRDRKDASLLLTAARLLEDSKARAVTAIPEVSGGDTSEPQPPMDGVLRSPFALLAEARSYAGDNQTLLALLGQYRFEAPPALVKGTAAGHHEFAKWLKPGAYATYHADFRGREPAEVAIWGDGSGDLDLVIYDSRHRPVCVSRSIGDREWCRWFPQAQEQFYLVVESRSPRWNYYSIFTN